MLAATETSFEFKIGFRTNKTKHIINIKEIYYGIFCFCLD